MKKDLHKIKYRKVGNGYELIKNYTIQTKICLDESKRIKGFDDKIYAVLCISGCLEIRSGYFWDGGSGPAIDTKIMIFASLFHDVKYQMMRLGLIGQEWRDTADLEFKQDLLDAGAYKIRAEWCYLAVKTFAKRASLPNLEDETIKVYEAP